MVVCYRILDIKTFLTPRFIHGRHRHRRKLIRPQISIDQHQRGSGNGGGTKTDSRKFRNMIKKKPPIRDATTEELELGVKVIEEDIQGALRKSGER